MTFIYNIPVKLNIPAFKSNKAANVPPKIQDSFSTNPLYDKFGDKFEIENIAKTNPKIKELLKAYKLPLKINSEELEKLKKGHLKDTRIVSAQIYSALPPELKKEINQTEIQQAAMFHDYGKVLITDSILNKEGKLSEKEREIMQLHSELGYELLKNKGLDKNTLNLIKYHHQTPDGKGYPTAPNNFSYGIDFQILNTADKYAALREKRSYKDAMTRKEALEIIKEDISKGLILQEVYDALQKGV